MLRKSLCAFSLFVLFSLFISVKTFAADQIILVTTKNTSSVTGHAQRYEKDAKTSQWQKVGAPFAIVVGKKGIAWDPALQKKHGFKGEVKKEGDQKAPAGIFKLTSAFGFDKKVSIPMSYFQVNPNTVCVDDGKSRYYNQILEDTSKIKNKDWKSAEQMREYYVYRRGAVVDYNPNKQRGNGSCIFLHVWKSKYRSTLGCIAMQKANMMKVQRWLDPKKEPVIAISAQEQLPELTSLLKKEGLKI